MALKKLYFTLFEKKNCHRPVCKVNTNKVNQWVWHLVNTLIEKLIVKMKHTPTSAVCYEFIIAYKICNFKMQSKHRCLCNLHFMKLHNSK